MKTYREVIVNVLQKFLDDNVGGLCLFQSRNPIPKIY